MAKEIRRFEKEYFFLSNFYPAKVTMDGVEYPSVEAAFQAAKTLDPQKRIPFQTMAPDKAKHAGRRLPLRPDWEQVKDSIMEMLLRSKFSDPELKKRLAKLGHALLVEGNTWHDNYWGSCSCPKCANIPGQNKLGRLLQNLKSEFSSQVLLGFSKYDMTEADLKARSTIRQYYNRLAATSNETYRTAAGVKDTQDAEMMQFQELDCIAHLFAGGCGDQYIVMAQEAAKRGFKSVIDIGCDRGWACQYFYAHDLVYTGIEQLNEPCMEKAPCVILRMAYPTPISTVMSYDRETTVGVSSLCVGWFKPIEEQLRQLAMDFRYAMLTTNEEMQPLLEKYFTVTPMERELVFLESKL